MSRNRRPWFSLGYLLAVAVNVLLIVLLVLWLTVTVSPVAHDTPATLHRHQRAGPPLKRYPLRSSLPGKAGAGIHQEV